MSFFTIGSLKAVWNAYHADVVSTKPESKVTHGQWNTIEEQNPDVSHIARVNSDGSINEVITLMNNKGEQRNFYLEVGKDGKPKSLDITDTTAGEMTHLKFNNTNHARSFVVSDSWNDEPLITKLMFGNMKATEVDMRNNQVSLLAMLKRDPDTSKPLKLVNLSLDVPEAKGSPLFFHSAGITDPEKFKAYLST